MDILDLCHNPEDGGRPGRRLAEAMA